MLVNWFSDVESEITFGRKELWTKTREWGSSLGCFVDILVSQYAPVAWYRYEGYACVGKGGEENVGALNERMFG